MLESLNYSFRNPKKHNLSNLPHQTVEKLQKNHGVLRGPQLGKQRWQPRLGILRVKVKRHLKNLRKMKTVISLWVYCVIFVISPNGGSLLSDHVYNKFWWKRKWQQEYQVSLQQDHMIIINSILQLHHRTQRKWVQVQHHTH